ncbi:hypothetical protein Q8F55_008770 [Vanrija albida]|uniref:Uncharacterized protein n=1 Tax=Vanrija albida TaxID=181172 RepID=A0ABR3PRQ8_9TREE
MSGNPTTYSSLKDLKHGHGHAADQSTGRKWWGGKKSSAPPTPVAEPESYAPSSSSSIPGPAAKSRYIPPSQRAAGAPMFERVEPTRAEREAEAKRQQSWGEWANENAQWASESVSETYSNTFNAQNRDKVLGGIGTGAAKVAGGAVKYTAKGIWAVGKAATK